MTNAAARDFPVQWRRPEDAERLWIWDGMHCPQPMTRLSQDFMLRMQADIAMVNDPLNPNNMPMFPNGYLYSPFDPPDPTSGPRMGERAQMAEEAKHLRRDWTGRWLPRIRRVKAFITGTATGSMTLDQLISHVDRCLTRAAYGFGATMQSARRMGAASEPFYEFCDTEIGPDGIGLASASIQGYTNESSAAETALYDLALKARELKVDGLIQSAPAAGLQEKLSASAAGKRFLAELDGFLHRYGWRTPTWFELSSPSWREDPTEPLRLVQAYLAGEAHDPREALARSAAARGPALRELRSRIPQDKRARFEELWRSARQFVPVSEGRALWQLSLGGFLRVPVLALGRRLVDAGWLAEANDVCYMSMEEISTDRETDWRPLVAERKAERERWKKVVPPMTLGVMRPPPGTAGGGPPQPMQIPLAGRLVSGFGGERSTDERILKGHAGSPGVIQGIARVVETVDEADKVEPGDILVCRFTTPSWSHLFSRVGGIVADSGGVLSHCAILAREYAIPCVPGVRVGTRRIRDGMRLTVDGSQGIVRLED